MSSSPADELIAKAPFITYDLVIRGGLVGTATDAVVTDLGIAAGRIAAVGAGLPANWREIDARGLVVVPGGVDVHTHLDLDLAGMRTADDFEWGTAAAACGGVTTVCDYAWQPPGVSLAQTIDMWRAKARGRAARRRHPDDDRRTHVAFASRL